MATSENQFLEVTNKIFDMKDISAGFKSSLLDKLLESHGREFWKGTMGGWGTLRYLPNELSALLTEAVTDCKVKAGAVDTLFHFAFSSDKRLKSLSPEYPTGLWKKKSKEDG